VLLSLSFPPLLFVVHLPLFPVKEVCLVIGLLPFVVAHPYVRVVLPVLVNDFVYVVPFLIVRLGILKDRTFLVIEVVEREKERGKSRKPTQTTRMRMGLVVIRGTGT